MLSVTKCAARYINLAVFDTVKAGVDGLLPEHMPASAKQQRYVINDQVRSLCVESATLNAVVAEPEVAKCCKSICLYLH